jgi:hypothetical protein
MGPLQLHRNVADTLGWAQFSCLEMLPMPLDGPSGAPETYFLW